MHKIKGFIIFFCDEENLLETDYNVKRMLLAARNKGIEIDVFASSQLQLIISNNGGSHILLNGKTTPLPDFIIPYKGSDTDFHDFALYRQLEYLGVYICNNSASIYKTQNKLHLYQEMAHNNIPIPKVMLMQDGFDIELINQELGFPLIIKRAIGTEGQGVYLCETIDKFDEVISQAYGEKEDSDLILQKFAKKSRGRDIRVFVVGEQVIGCMLRVSSKDFRANYSNGATVEKYPITPEIENLAIKVAKLSALEITGIDLLFDEDGLKVCEANSAPSFIAMEKVMGPVIAESIIDYIIKNCELNRNKENKNV